MRRILLAVLLVVPGAASAQVPEPLTREYVLKLANVYGEIRSIAFVRDICAAEHPGLAAANEAAFQAWRSKRHAFLEEMEQRWAAAVERLARGQPPGRADFADQFEARLQAGKADVGQRMKARGPEEFRRSCEAGYSELLLNERADLERRFAPLVATIRNGLGESYVPREPAAGAAARRVGGYPLAEFPQPGTSGDIRLIDAGTGARRVLRRHLEQGSSHRGLITLQLALSVRMDGQRAPRSKVPGLELPMLFRVAEAGGPLERVEFSVPEAPRLTDTDGVDPRLIEHTRASLSALQALRGHILSSDRGIVRDVQLGPQESGDPQLRQLIQSVRQSMEQSTLPLPAEAVGPGARWKELQHAQRNGADIYLVTSYELRRIDGDTLTIAVEVEQYAPTQPLRVAGAAAASAAGSELVYMRATGRGESTLDLRSPVPRMRGSFESEVVMNVRGGELISQTAVIVELQTRVEPAAR